MITLGTLSIELEKKIPVQLHESSSIITQGDYLNAIMYVRVERQVREALNHIDVQGEHLLNVWTVDGKGTYVGSWSKRLGKYLYKTQNIKLDPQILSTISERISRALSGTKESLQIEFSKQTWEPGEFGEKTTSCWFKGSGYTHCLPALLDSSGGGAIKIYTDRGATRARCWYYNIDGSLLIFNAYDKLGRLTLLSIARILSVLYGMDYKKHYDVTIDTAYINGQSIYAIGNPPIQRAISLDFAIRNHHSPRPTLCIPSYVLDNDQCRHCHAQGGTPIVINHTRRCSRCTEKCRSCQEVTLIELLGTGRNCPNCIEKYYITCPGCGNPYKKEDACSFCADSFTCCDCDEVCTGTRYERNGEYICEDCMDENYSTCNDCDHIEHNDDMYFMNNLDRAVCSNCLDNYTRCNRCNEWESSDDTASVRGRNYCTSCASDVLSRCDRCEEMEHNSYIREVSGRPWCEECTNHHAMFCDECNSYFDIEDNHEHGDEDET